MSISEFSGRNHKFDSINTLVGHYWLVSSKIARKAGHLQAAYSALLQGRHRGAPYHFIQGCKLLQRNGETIRALQELNNALVLKNDAHTGFIDLTEPDEDRLDRAKVGDSRRFQIVLTDDRHGYCEQDGWKHLRDFLGLNLMLNLVTLHNFMKSNDGILCDRERNSTLIYRWESSYFHWALYLDRSQVHKDIPGNQLEE